MDSERFDDLIKRLGATRATRASAIRGLAAALAAIGGGTLAATGAGARKRRGKGRVKSQRAPQADAGKVTICHRTHSATNPVVEIEVSGNAVAKHVSQHGDFLKGDCCVDSQCSDLDDQCNVGRCLVDDETNEGNCKAVCREGDIACDDENRCTEDDKCRPNDDDDDDLSCSCRGRPVVCPACLNCDPSSGQCSIDTCPAGETCDPDTGQCEGGDACESDSECGANEVCCLIDGAKFEGQCAVRRNCCTTNDVCPPGRPVCCLAAGEHTNQCVAENACP